ncbi:hypothetical protein PSM36_0310 [Proteiniphilum saccharofermentans]|uniref:Uncharacterized protein n=1 Tax=Proteiniphilum saccharofermentans TaxID=1642647 RepID=A0A1R3T6E7_9BACT|nr:hypothetical protein PSM36_0310 [Proteiniphilum saccharofermentans]
MPQKGFLCLEEFFLKGWNGNIHHR